MTVLREPGGVAVSERIRSLLADPSLELDPRAEALLFAAARAQLVAQKLRPLLDAGETVLLDRFVDSSLAYQGGGRGLGIDEIRAINQFGTGGLRPDRTLLLRVDPRWAWRGSRTGRPTGSSSRTATSSRAIARAYDELAAAEPERIARDRRLAAAGGRAGRRAGGARCVGLVPLALLLLLRARQPTLDRA